VKRILGLGSIGFLFLLAGCNSVTLFQSSFSSHAVGAPPSHNQSTGTIDIAGAPGSVMIVPPPPTATGNWAQISRTGGPGAPITTMQCSLSQFKGDGSYSLLAVLFIPSGSGLATVEFETFGQASPSFAGFLHLDFLRTNTVRINDDPAQVFGTFPRDQFFTLAVTLDITPSSATAHMQLFGTGASGSKDFNVTPLFLARQFGAVKFWMGFPWNGSFDVTDILVTRKT
jgi:hypothetical protein